MIAEIESEYIALARAVIIQAARDAAGGDRGAAAWLANDETADLWFLVAGLRRDYVMAWLVNGCKIKAGIKKPNKKERSQPTKRQQATPRTIPVMG